MQGDQVLGDPQTQAGAGVALGSEEGFEDPIYGGWGHSVAGIGDGYAQAGLIVVRVATIAQPDSQAGSVRCGVDRVPDDVGDGLANVTGAANQGFARLVFAFDLQFTIQDSAPVERKDRIEEFGDCGWRRGGGLLVEAEGLRGDFADPL